MPKRLRTDDGDSRTASDTVRLNVGGKRFDVSLQTANAFGYLRGMLAWGTREPDDDVIFVVRDPALFEILLLCVRTSTRPPQREIDNKKRRALVRVCLLLRGRLTF